jgi:nicotinamidase-related amidase
VFDTMRAQNCAVLLIDHQPSQLANLHSHELTMVINNVTGLAKTTRAFGVPTILTTIARDWARTERPEEVAQILFDHAGASGAVLAWELANEAMRA